MAGQYKEAAAIAQKMNSGGANSFVAKNKRDLLKDLNYQGNKVTKYASEVSLNSAAQSYQEGRLTSDQEQKFGFYQLSHDASLKTEMEFDKEGFLEEGFVKNTAADVYRDPLKVVQGQKNEIKRRRVETYSYTCTTPKTFEFRVRRRLHYRPPPRTLQSNVVDFRYADFMRSIWGIAHQMRNQFPNLDRNQRRIEIIKKYGGPYIVQVDVHTGKRLNIKCKNITNMDQLMVSDATWVCVASDAHSSSSCARLLRFHIQHYTYQTDETDYEGWETVNPETEEFTKKMNCSIKSRRCLDEVPREFDELTVKRPCWEDEVVYQCDGDHDNSCKKEDIKNCSLSKSEPITYEIPQPDAEPFSIITGYTRFYACQKETQETDLEIGGKVPFCLDGSCHQVSSHKDQDFSEVISKLNILKKMGESQTGEPIHVFTGEPPHGRSCKVNIADFKDCCQSKGWGQAIGLGGCSPEEKNLAKLKQVGQCHYVGSFCSEKILGFCVARKHSYCCFGSRLEREVQVQGSPQVGKGFGDAKHPNCRGFTVDELSRLDFDRINLTPLFEELVRSKVRGKDMTSAFSSSYKSHFAMAQPDLHKKFKTRAESKGGDL